MGVIHKLREDVVSFIVAQKKSDSSVSVRKLAALTSEKFQIKVSKSSVSIVLKGASLSSSVGRRSGSADSCGTRESGAAACASSEPEEASRTARSRGTTHTATSGITAEASPS